MALLASGRARPASDWSTVPSGPPRRILIVGTYGLPGGSSVEEERIEREERRGLEARGGALLAAGAAVVGLVATAIRDLNVSSAEKAHLLILADVATGLTAVSLLIVAVALAGGRIPRGAKSPKEYAADIREHNESIVGPIRVATVLFAFGVGLFLAAIIWSAYATGPSPVQMNTVVVKSERGSRGRRGASGPRGRAGERGREGPPGPVRIVTTEGS
jgi:hypothetical protein